MTIEAVNEPSEKTERRNGITHFLKTASRFSAGPLITIAIVLLFFCLWSYWFYGSINSGWARINGFQLVPEKSVLDLGVICSGETKSGVFKLKNIGKEPITVLGAEVDCSCIKTHRLPLTVAPNSTIDFSFDFHADDSAVSEDVFRQMILYLDVDQPKVVLKAKVHLIANVVPNISAN